MEHRIKITDGDRHNCPDCGSYIYRGQTHSCPPIQPWTYTPETVSPICKTSLESKIKKLIVGTTKDLVSSFLYYDRKEDEELGVGEIEASIKRGDVTIEEIILVFKNELRDALEDA